MFDFTPEIKLNSQEKKTYRRWQVVLYFITISLAIFFAYIILFPTAYFTFSFLNPSSNKNNIVTPRINNVLPEKGVIPRANGELFFDTALLGNYSKAIVEFTLNNKSANPTDGSVALQKGYQAYFYPEGEKVNYQTQKDSNGIVSGDLVAYGESAYVISNNLIYPINNIDTFTNHGYSWDDLKTVSPDIISLYAKQPLFNISSPHPNGTIFLSDNGKYYLVDNNKKFPLSENSIINLPQRKPINVSEKSLEIKDFCNLKKSGFWGRTFSCEIPLEKYAGIIGMDYEFKTTFQDDVKIDEINVRFKKEFSLASLKNTIWDILRRVKNNYASTN